MKTLITIAIISISWLLPAQDVRSNLEAEITEIDRQIEGDWKSLRTAEDYTTKCTNLRRKLLSAIGKFPKRTPLNAKILKREDYGSYRLEKLIYESRPGQYVTGLIFLPNSTEFKPPYPACIFCCGHVDGGKSGIAYLQAGVMGALNGYAMLLTDPVGQGEREQGIGVRNVQEHVRLGALAALLGRSLNGIMLWDLMRGLDYLEAREDINREQLACAGHSGGGTMSSYLGALDPRIKAVIPACYISSIREVIDACGPQDPEQNIYGQLKFGFNHLGLMMLNDNPWCLNLAKKDFFPYSGSLTTLKIAKQVAHAIGKDARRYHRVTVDCAHALKDGHRAAIVEWMNLWLRHKPNYNIVKLEDLSTITTNIAQVTASNQVRELNGFKSHYDYLIDDWQELILQRPNDTKVRDAQMVELAGINIKSSKNPKIEQPDKPSVIIATIGENPMVNQLADEERQKHKHVVIAKLMAADSTQWSKPKRTGKGSYYGNRSDDEEIAVELYLLGRTLVGERASELLTCAEKLRNGVGVELIAIGRAVIPAAFACAANRSAFDSVRVIDAPPSWEASLQQHALVSFADIVPGALAISDWPTLLGK